MYKLTKDSLFATALFFGGISVISCILVMISAISIPISLNYNEK
jgi:hypothetical protein